MNNTQANDAKLFPVPSLAPDMVAPAAVRSISITKKDGSTDFMKITIKRDLQTPIESFTFKYRFSTLPVYVEDPKHQFNSYVYKSADINSKEMLSFDGEVPSQLTLDGCSAYISEIKFANGLNITYEPSEFKFVRKPIKKNNQQQNPPLQSSRNLNPPQNNSRTSNRSQIQNSQNQKSNVQGQNLENSLKKQSPASSNSLHNAQKKKFRTTAILTTVIFITLIEIIGGVYLYNFLGVKKSTDFLIKDGLYNEAYKLSSMTSFNALTQRVCEKASVYYFEKGDLENAYVYAYAAPKPFCDVIIDYAASSVINIEDGKINESAFRVAKMSENDEKFDSIVLSICEILKGRGDFSNALLVISELRDNAKRDAAEKGIFTDAIKHYVSSNKYWQASAFIDGLDDVTSFNLTKEEIIKSAIEACKEIDDSAGIIYLSQKYPEYAENISAKEGVDADDAGVRSELAIVYPLLSAEQKRAYHQKTFSVSDGIVTEIINGEIKSLSIKDAVSIDENSFCYAILHNSGKITVTGKNGYKIPYNVKNITDAVKISLGENHILVLHQDGTVTALGDNSFGQCNTKDFKDIADISAGQNFSLCLKSDGTALAVGSNSSMQCKVEGYQNIVDIIALNQTSVLLFKDGTVKLCGYRSMGLKDIEKLTFVSRIEGAYSTIVAETLEGKYYVFSGSSGNSVESADEWSDIMYFDVGNLCIAAKSKTGTVYTDGLLVKEN